MTTRQVAAIWIGERDREPGDVTDLMASMTEVGVSAATIGRAVRDGELEAHHLRGTLPRILHRDLEAWVESAPTERKTA